MNNKRPPRILLFERQKYWRELASAALRREGYQFEVRDNYRYHSFLFRGKPDLVILGCANVGPEEKKLIQELIHRGHRVLVLGTSISTSMTRSLFLLGVSDVADKPFAADALLEIVAETFEGITPRNAYQAVEERGVV